MHRDLVAELERLGFVSRIAAPHLAGAIDHHRGQGRLVRVLGNCYATPGAAGEFGLKVSVARETYPNGVFIRETAAKLTWWPELKVDHVQLATTQRSRPHEGFRFERREVPTELRNWDGEHFLSSPALTVLDLTDTFGGTAIDESLRRGAVTLEALHHALALTPGRRGNQERARLLYESRAEPWSPLEREAHVRLRRAQFRGWVANHEIVINGKGYVVDLAVPEIRLAAEIDGWEFHRTFQSFVSDRAKWNALTLAGWTVLHFTASTLDDLTTQMATGVAVAAAR